MGVGAEFEGKSYAGVLSKPKSARMDTKHLPCCLETHNGKNVPIFEHYGSKVVEEGTTPDTGTAHWAMSRQESS